jgi:pimeloyl-ACP methyl ester carboxylesterase
LADSAPFAPDRARLDRCCDRHHDGARRFAYFASFPKTATDFAELAKTQLTIPVLSMGGAKANAVAPGEQVKLIAPNAKIIVLENTGHWIMEERPKETMDALVAFLR